MKETGGIRFLPIWVGSVEATAIAFAQQGLTPPRPLTHDLIVNLLKTLEVDLLTIHLTELRDGIFYAVINLSGERSISARPSDAIALALRTNKPILASEELFEAAGIEIPDQSDDEVEKFREFLDQINPEDFLG